MAIEVKHGANPASTIYGRFGGAEGRSWRDALAQFLRARERQELQRRSQEFAKEQSDLNYQRTLDRQAMTQDYNMAMSDRKYFQDIDRMNLVEGNRQQLLEDKIKQGGEQEKELYDYKLTAEQKADEAKLRQALYLIENDESLSPDERLEARRRLVARLADIEPLPVRKEPSRYTPGQDIGDYWYDQSVGGYLTRDDRGNIKEINNGGMSEAEAWKMAFSASAGENGVDVNKAKNLFSQIMGYGVQGQIQAPEGESFIKPPEPSSQITGSTQQIDQSSAPIVVRDKMLKTVSDIDSQIEEAQSALNNLENKFKNKEYRIDAPGFYRKGAYKYETKGDLEDQRKKAKAKLDELNKKKQLMYLHLKVMDMNLSQADRNRLSAIDALMVPIGQ